MFSQAPLAQHLVSLVNCPLALNYECESATDLKQAFEEAVDDYFDMYEQEQLQPIKTIARQIGI